MDITISPSLVNVVYVVAALMALIPIASIAFFKFKYHGFIGNAIIGLCAFFLSVFVVESFAHSLILASPIGSTILSNGVLYAAYGGLMAAIFEEGTRFLIFKCIGKRFNSISDALMYGFGHGGMEMLIIGALNMFSNAMILQAIANNDLASVIGTAEMTPELIASISAMAATPVSMYFLSLLERILAFVLHVVLSVIVFTAVYTKAWGLFGVAILAHFAVDFMAGLYSTNVLTALGISATAGLVLVYAVLIVVDLGLITWVKKTNATQWHIPFDHVID